MSRVEKWDRWKAKKGDTVMFESSPDDKDILLARVTYLLGEKYAMVEDLDGKREPYKVRSDHLRVLVRRSKKSKNKHVEGS